MAVVDRVGTFVVREARNPSRYAISRTYTCTCGWKRQNVYDPTETVQSHLDVHRLQLTEQQQAVTITERTKHECCRCGGCGEEGYPDAPWDSADALDTCYHCSGSGACFCLPELATEGWR